MLSLLGLLAVLASPPPVAAPAPAPSPIFGGDLVEPGTWPSTVAILIGETLCTGTLVSERVVLTAAHCLADAPSPGLMFVVIGDDIWTDYDRIVTVDEYGAHPDFCGTDTEVCKVDIWDYAYVVLSEPVTEFAPTRPLSRQDEWDEAMRVGSPVTLVGFGNDEKELDGFKRRVDVDIVRFSGSGLEFQAGGMGLDSCQGDSGGPAFVTLATGEVVLAGITSRGYDCGKGGFYAVPYAALCWLNEETGVDLRSDACEACDCLDIAPQDDDGGCGCAAQDGGGGPLGLAGLLLLAGLRRSGDRRRRRSRP